MRLKLPAATPSKQPEKDAMNAGEELIEVLKSCLPGISKKNPAPLHEPDLSGAEHHVLNTVKSGFVSTVGPVVEDFRLQLSKYVGNPHITLVSSGTSALFLALKSAGVGPGDEVIIPNLTFIATANAVVHCGASPVAVDVESDESGAMGICPQTLKDFLASRFKKSSGGPRNKVTGARLAAVVPVFLLGRMGDTSAIRQIAAEWHLKVVEDAAEALGSVDIAGDKPGTHATSALSFNGNKIVTTGGGGAIISTSEETAAELTQMSTNYKRPHEWEFVHDKPAWNLRMPAINAALGVSQLDLLPAFIKKKRALAQLYFQKFVESQYFEPFGVDQIELSNNWLIPIRTRTNISEEEFSQLFQASIRAGWGIRPLWKPITSQPAYLDVQHSNVAASLCLSRTLICLPSSPKLLDVA